MINYFEREELLAKRIKILSNPQMSAPKHIKAGVPIQNIIPDGGPAFPVTGGQAMSDTPLTDIAEAMCDKLGVMDAIEYAIYHGQKIERELAEAKARIKELKEANK